ncbi:hypothetical protein [Photobacterium lipolyticum]|uniref:Uncharacterized protein n=1 Tax=Photobacterium lipolyticum TaxID=266810 RepID=A0A2T3MWV9_9GAMM|nr:hypothetical protein [Photobacterium lipolyticum]PSW04464.1 hypothetical protein C9I89_14210 [Photobacterium lipolyticum]
MSIREFCSIEGLEISYGSELALKEINDIVERGNLLASLTASLVVIQVINGTFKGTAQNITKYDWEQFGEAMIGVNKITRTRVGNTAFDMALKTTGKEYSFWKCIYESTL